MASMDITETMDAEAEVFAPPPAATADAVRRLALLCELPLQFGSETDTRSLLQTIASRLLDLIPQAGHAAVLVKDRASGQLLLRAWAPDDDEPRLSLSSAQKAIDQRQAFVWRREGDLTSSQSAYDIASGMYAPLLWRGDALGAVSVDTCERAASFAVEDLRLLMAIAQYAAMILASHAAQEDVRRHAEFTRRLFASHFPAPARERLLRQAGEGTLVMGTRSSPVTVLISDIRGFTKLTSRLGPRATGDLLGEVFPRLVDVILAHDGTIERFAGDAIVAVFGSPDDDPRQHENAVRAGLAMQAAMVEIGAARAARGRETCGIGIGIDCGDVLHGFIGDADRIQFAVVGEPANRASRFCDGARAGEVIVSPEIHERVFLVVHSKPASVQTKHEGELRGFRVTAMKA
jgi:adenylate cyclase